MVVDQRGMMRLEIVGLKCLSWSQERESHDIKAI